MKKLLFSILFSVGAIFNAQSQVSCSGTWTSVTNDCQTVTIGNGTAGFIKICFDVNNIPTGGGSSCNPGGACNPPYNGGGWAPRIAIYDSGGNLIDNILSTTAVGDCFYVPVADGYADIIALCLTAGTQISWETVDACGNNLCAGSPPPCNPPGSCDCANPCGPACGWATTPTVAQVTANCTEYPYLPELGPLTNSSSCYTFVAASTSVDFNVIVTSDCGAGNVTGFTWDVYATGSCVAPIYSGTLASLTMSPMIVGQSYTFCYDFTTPNCTHTSHYPYFVGASALPIDFKDFTGAVSSDRIMLNWETNNDESCAFYVIESSLDGINFEPLDVVQSAKSAEPKVYSAIDHNPSIGINYYRLTQVDDNQSGKVVQTININYTESYFEAQSFSIYNLGGQLIATADTEGQNVYEILSKMDLLQGMYIVKLNDSFGNNKTIKYFKEVDQ